GPRGRPDPRPDTDGRRAPGDRAGPHRPQPARPMTEMVVIPVTGMGEIEPGCDLGPVILAACTPEVGDVVVVTQKIVSKAENRLVPIDPKDPVSHKPLVLQEARRVIR